MIEQSILGGTMEYTFVPVNHRYDDILFECTHGRLPLTGLNTQKHIHEKLIEKGKKQIRIDNL
jgi:hypothetical protein